MSQNNVIPTQKINSAANGNESLREVLQAMTQTTNLQTNVTNTSGKPLPPQAKTTVSYLAGNYEVDIRNPGTSSPTSALQAAQAQKIATQTTNLSNISPILHQVRVATSPTFSISSNVQTFGGDTGSTQTHWTLTGLGSGRFYFQVRSSYDGINFNIWRNANGGQTITSGADGVTVEPVENGVFALFTLPGDQLISFGAGFVADGNSFGVPAELYTSGMQVIAGPNGYQPQLSNLAHGIIADSISIVPPNPPTATTGPDDFPTLALMRYEDGSGNIWTGSANVFALAYDPLGTNYTGEKTSDGFWVDFVLAGGAHLSVGSGVTADGVSIALPTTMPWVSGSNMLSIVSPAYGLNPTAQARGISDAVLNGTVMDCGFQDTTAHRWSSTGNWFAVSWSPGLPVTAVAGGEWLVLSLQSGQQIAIGAGVGVSGSLITLPAGFTQQNMLSMATPGSVDATSHPMAGVYQCDIFDLMLQLLYTDTQGNGISGNVNWMAFCWT